MKPVTVVTRMRSRTGPATRALFQPADTKAGRDCRQGDEQREGAAFLPRQPHQPGKRNECQTRQPQNRTTPAPAAAGSQRNGRRSAISRSSASRNSARGSPKERRSRPTSPKLAPAIAADPPCCPLRKAYPNNTRHLFELSLGCHATRGRAREASRLLSTP